MIENSPLKINLVNRFNSVFKLNFNFKHGLNFIYWNYLNIKTIVWKVNKNYVCNLNEFEIFIKHGYTLLREISYETRFVHSFQINMKLYAKSLSR